VSYSTNVIRMTSRELARRSPERPYLQNKFSSIRSKRDKASRNPVVELQENAGLDQTKAWRCLSSRTPRSGIEEVKPIAGSSS
jgi:hypothetical protein